MASKNSKLRYKDKQKLGINRNPKQPKRNFLKKANRRLQ